MINTKTETDFFLCTICFNASEASQTCHGREMIHCMNCDTEQRKPLMDGNGRLLNRAPLWFINATNHAPLSTITAN
jgi:hypothetical protein